MPDACLRNFQWGWRVKALAEPHPLGAGGLEPVDYFYMFLNKAFLGKF